MASNAELGAQAEAYIVEHFRCPSCGHELRALPPGYPLYDVQCSRCLLRAQVKRVRAKPRDRIRGASWTVLSHHLKTGHLLPPMFVCFGWPADAFEPSNVWFLSASAGGECAQALAHGSAQDGARPRDDRIRRHAGAASLRTPRRRRLTGRFSRRPRPRRDPPVLRVHRPSVPRVSEGARRCARRPACSP